MSWKIEINDHWLLILNDFSSKYKVPEQSYNTDNETNSDNN